MKRSSIITKWLLGASFALIFMVQSVDPASARGEPLSAGGVEVLSAQSGPVDPQELEGFLDGIITAQLSAYHLPGATVAVVKDSDLLFSKGYGYSNIEEQIPVVADQTLFRPGSITKLFTWTAIMQLVEQGKLDLNANVNVYLNGFQIPDTYPRPITLANLLTHTSGLEDRGEGLYVRVPEDMQPLSDYASRYLPTRIRPPGEMMGYSNYGAGLAGYIIESVSGLPYEKYIEENILIPLGMTHSTMLQPPPTDLAMSLAQGYKYVNGTYLPIKEWIQATSTGALSATATDIAKFMIAHLQNGCYRDECILEESTARDMHTRHFAQDPRAGGWTYGFMEMELNGRRILWHGGATLYFHSALFLLPDENTGLFVSYNSQGGMPAHEALIRAFMDRYYPVPKPPLLHPSTDFTAHSNRFIGIYRGSNHQNETGLEKMMSLSSEIPVTLTSAGTLKTVGLGFGWPAFTPVFQWVQTEEPLVFRRLDGGENSHFSGRRGGKHHQLCRCTRPTGRLSKKKLYGYIRIYFAGGRRMPAFIPWDDHCLADQLLLRDPAAHPCTGRGQNSTSGTLAGRLFRSPEPVLCNCLPGDDDEPGDHLWSSSRVETLDAHPNRAGWFINVHGNIRWFGLGASLLGRCREGALHFAHSNRVCLPVVAPILESDACLLQALTIVFI